MEQILGINDTDTHTHSKITIHPLFRFKCYLFRLDSSQMIVGGCFGHHVAVCWQVEQTASPGAHISWNVCWLDALNRMYLHLRVYRVHVLSGVGV